VTLGLSCGHGSPFWLPILPDSKPSPELLGPLGESGRGEKPNSCPPSWSTWHYLTPSDTCHSIMSLAIWLLLLLTCVACAPVSGWHWSSDHLLRDGVFPSPALEFIAQIQCCSCLSYFGVIVWDLRHCHMHLQCPAGPGPGFWCHWGPLTCLPQPKGFPNSCQAPPCLRLWAASKAALVL
jgi:hypothetical protein